MKEKEVFIDQNMLPKHVAIIMDGNGRWAKKRFLPRYKGHEKGFEALKAIIKANEKFKIPVLSFFAFSTENWNRSKEEINYLMSMIDVLAKEYLPVLNENNIKLVLSGTTDYLTPKLRDKLLLLEEKALKNAPYILNLAFNYGGKKEIVDAVSKIIKEKIDDTDITQEVFQKYLYHPELPDVDLLIRTSGEKRLSNFFLWQNAYAEFYFTDVLWPDFQKKDFEKALLEYQNRNRRFGKE